MNQPQSEYLKMSNFQQMEADYALFDYKNEIQLPVWDILRYHVYWKYLSSNTNFSVNEKKRKSLKFYFNSLIILLSSSFSLIFRKKEYILFSYARNIDNKGLLFDIVSENIIKELEHKALIIGKRKAMPKYKHKTEFAFVNLLSRFIKTKSNLSKPFYETIQKAFEKEFEDVRFTYDELNGIYSQFQKEYHYYRCYFKYKKPKKVFFVQEGIQKGMIHAAHSLNIPIIELQHGIFNYEHPAYSYPVFITEKDDRVILPDLVLTFSNYWGKNMNLPARTISIGNDFFAEHLETQTDYSVLIISSVIHGEYLSKLAIEYADLHPDIKIIFKLHANEYREEDNYKKQFSRNKNIHIIKNERSVKELSACASLVVLISSTVLFEALQTNAKVGIYKRLNYDFLSDCFTLPNVYLLNSAENLHNAYLTEKKENNTSFFDKFDREQFTSLLTNNNL